MNIEEIKKYYPKKKYDGFYEEATRKYLEKEDLDKNSKIILNTFFYHIKKF